MAIIKVQKGTKDILPSEMPIWHFMEEKANEIFTKYGAKEIRTPIFEATELFARGVGDHFQLCRLSGPADGVYG